MGHRLGIGRILLQYLKCEWGWHPQPRGPSLDSNQRNRPTDPHVIRQTIHGTRQTLRPSNEQLTFTNSCRSKWSRPMAHHWTNKPTRLYKERNTLHVRWLKARHDNNNVLLLFILLPKQSLNPQRRPSPTQHQTGSASERRMERTELYRLVHNKSTTKNTSKTYQKGTKSVQHTLWWCPPLTS